MACIYLLNSRDGPQSLNFQMEIFWRPLTKKSLEHHKSHTTNHTLHNLYKFVCLKKVNDFNSGYYLTIHNN